MSAPTPGPWTTGGIFDPNGPDPRTNVWSKRPRGAQSGHIVAHDVRVVDAHLIAAAPELYTALKQVQDWLLETGQLEDDGITHPLMLKANNLAVAAIAKAEGR